MKKKFSLSKTKDDVSEKIGFTGDIILGDTIVTMEGDRCLYIENYKGILSYDDKSILVKTKRSKLLVEGKNLQIEYYTHMDMKIKGILFSVKNC